MNNLYPRAQIAICDTCQIKHLSKPYTLEAIEFFERHKGHALRIADRPEPMLSRLNMLLGVDLFRVRLDRLRHNGRERLRWFEVDRLGVAGYRDNANVNEAFGTATSMTVTNALLANSATAGWKSASIDNTANLYMDYEFGLELLAVNTAPSSDKAIYLFAFGLVDPAGTAYTSTGSGTANGSEGTLTYPNVSTSGVVAPILGVVPYPIQNQAINYGPMSHAAAFGLPIGVSSKLAVGMVNFSGMTLSGVAVRYRGVYLTVT